MVRGLFKPFVFNILLTPKSNRRKALSLLEKLLLNPIKSTLAHNKRERVCEQRGMREVLKDKKENLLRQHDASAVNHVEV